MAQNFREAGGCYYTHSEKKTRCARSHKRYVNVERVRRCRWGVEEGVLLVIWATGVQPYPDDAYCMCVWVFECANIHKNMLGQTDATAMYSNIGFRKTILRLHFDGGIVFAYVIRIVSYDARMVD